MRASHKWDSLRTFDSVKGNKIIELVYKHEPRGTGFRLLQREAGFSSRRTVELVLNRLRDLEIIRRQPRIPIRLTASALEKYKQGIQLLSSSPKKGKYESESVLTKRQRIEIFKKEKEMQNIYIRVVAIAHFGSSYSRRLLKGTKIQAGDRVVNDLTYFLNDRKLRYLTYRNYSIPGVGLKDIINKRSRAKERVEYLPSKVKPPLLFAQIPVTEEDAMRHVRDLMDHNPPILKPFNSNPKGKTRYEIANQLLREFVSKCLILHFSVRDRMKRSLTYKNQCEEQIRLNTLDGLTVYTVTEENPSIF